MGAVASFAEDSNGAIWASNGSGVFRSESGQNFAEVMEPSPEDQFRGIGCLKGGRRRFDVAGLVQPWAICAGRMEGDGLDAAGGISRAA